jgi:hypothetical protein
MSAELRSATVIVPRARASAPVAARAALEMTATCWVWLERADDGLVVRLVERVAHAGELAARYDAELDRIARLASHEKRTRLVRAAIIGQALAAAPRARVLQPAAPTLDPETEAEIEKLLAEIESDDWLDDASEIAKTWEERFGAGTKNDCEEKG